MERNKTTYTPEALAALDADALALILREQLQKPACELDDALVRQLLRELEARGQDPALTDDMAVEKACEKFRQDTAKRKHPRYRSWLITAASVAVVLGILLFTLPGTAEAENIKDVLARWTDSVFHFFSPGEPAFAAEDYVFETDNPGLQQIYDEVVALGITDPVVPMWVPEGLELKKLETFQLAEDISLAATIDNEDQYIIISLVGNSDIVPFQHEKALANIEIIEASENEHYLIPNQDNYSVTWILGSIECSIITNCREEEIHKMINSIYFPEV